MQIFFIFKVVAGKKYCVVVDVGSSSECPKGPENVDATLAECPVEEKEVSTLEHSYYVLMFDCRIMPKYLSVVI